jgi:hypothetical protein
MRHEIYTRKPCGAEHYLGDADVSGNTVLECILGTDWTVSI